MIDTGNLILRRYKVVKSFQGGMGIVYLSIDITNDFPVALKTFKPELFPDENARGRFLREATVWINLGWHPNVVQAYIVEFDPVTHNTYLALELIPSSEGMKDPSLREWLNNHTTNVEWALDVALGIVRGMKYANSKIPGLIHRDLKPENILIGLDGNPRITDFGLATIENTWSNSANIQLSEHTNNMVGTPLYMSPEQWKNLPIDMKADVYAFGCILFEMITGKIAVEAEDIQGLFQMHISGSAIKKLNKLDIPVRIKELLSRCLDVNPENRIGSWKEIEAHLQVSIEELFNRQSPANTLPEDVSLYGQIRRGESFLGIGTAYLDLDNKNESSVYLYKAIEIGQAQSYLPLVAAATGNLGVLHSHMGLYDKAIGFYEDAIKKYLAFGNESAAAYNYGNLGNVLFRKGDFKKAKTCLEKALDIAKRNNDVFNIGRWLGNLGNIAITIKDFQTAIELQNQALQFSLMIKDRFSEHKALSNLGTAYELAGNDKKAYENYQNALKIQYEVNDKQSAVLTMMGLSKLSAKQGDIEHAIELATKALNLAIQTQNLSLVAQTKADLGALFAVDEKLSDAEANLIEAIKLARETNTKPVEARAKRSLGIVYEKQRDFHKAISHLREATLLFKELGMPEYLPTSEHLKDLRKLLGLL
jgi:serine/threonine protein kinase